jgi:hypothetical protein
LTGKHVAQVVEPGSISVDNGSLEGSFTTESIPVLI